MELRRGSPTLPSDETLLDLGYDLLEAALLADAVAIFEHNLGLHPTSAYSYDGLADAALAVGDTERAARHLQTSLRMDPANTYAINKLKRLRR